jgi:hypothetical protein
MKKILFIGSLFLACIMASAGIVFPELPVQNENAPLVIQLAASDSQITFRRPVTFYVRLVNNSNMQMELSMLPAESNINIYSCVWWYHSNPKTGDLRSYGNPFFFGKDHLLILPGKGTLIIKLPEKLLPIGEHEISVSYKFKDQEIRSNQVAVSVIEKPLSDHEKALMIKESLEMMLLFRSNDYGKDQWVQKIVENKVRIGGSYLVPELKALMNFPKTQETAIEILGMIADKDQSTKIGYLRDTSSADLVIDRIEKEPGAPMKVALLKIVGKFFDVLSQPQKEKLEKAILAQLAHADAGVRVQAALALLELFPKQQATVQAALAKPDFADESARKMIAEALAKAKEKSH